MQGSTLNVPFGCYLLSFAFRAVKHAVDNPVHRKELVAGDLGPHMEAGEETCVIYHRYLTKIVTEFHDAAGRVGDAAGDFFDVRVEQRGRFGLSFLEEPLKELPRVRVYFADLSVRI